MTRRDEQETTVTHLRSEDIVRIYTSNPVDARRLRKDKRITQVSGDETWGEFTAPITAFHPLKGIRRQTKPLSEEQRKARAARMRSLHTKEES